MADTLALAAQDLRKNYGSIRALKGVNLEVRKGEIFGFLGPNGAGKTTTIRCCLDLIRPNGGTLRVLGLDPQREPEAVRARTGYLPGELHFDESMTVAATLRFLLELRGKPSAWGYAQELAGRLGLDLAPAIKNLSKGNKQKIGVVQALMHKPELLLLDEPTSGVDPLVQKEILAMAGEAARAGATVFFSSHIISEVEEIAQRVAIIRGGVVVEVADPKALTARSLRRLSVRFREEIDAAPLAKLAGVTLLTPAKGKTVQIQVAGEIDPVIKALAKFPVADLETERPSLEEIFLAYYESGKGKGGRQ